MNLIKSWIRKIVCEHIEKKHCYKFAGSYFAYSKHTRINIHIQRCSACGHSRSIRV